MTLPALLPGQRIALAGLHQVREDDAASVAAWACRPSAPSSCAETAALLDRLAGTDCTKVAVHLDLDTVDGDEAFFGMVPEPAGLTITQVRQVMSDLADAVDVVALTIAEYRPRQAFFAISSTERRRWAAEQHPAPVSAPPPPCHQGRGARRPAEPARAPRCA